MTITTSGAAAPRRSTLDRSVAMRLAAIEYQQYAEVLRGLSNADWDAKTDCPEWTVRDMAGHNLGMAEMSASVFEQRRQMKAASASGGLFIDALTGHQVRKHQALRASEVADNYAAVAPRAAKARRRTPGLIRRRSMPVPQKLNDVDETWTLGYLIDCILTRDVWMHRVDTTRATGTDMVLTPDHDGVLVNNVVNEWSVRHGRQFELTLTGPAGGTWRHGSGGPAYELDAVEFCRILSGRASGDGLLTTEVPF
jgi:uncharacterized protein (TIGR03083 family)